MRTEPRAIDTNHGSPGSNWCSHSFRKPSRSYQATAREASSTRRTGTTCSSTSPGLAGAHSFTKSLFEPRVVSYGGEVVVGTRLLAERREQLGGSLEMAERLVVGVSRERCEARVVVVKGRVVRHAVETTADGITGVAVALLTVGGHRLVVERPRLAPVDPLVGLAGGCTECEDRSFPGRLPPRARRDGHECARRRVDRLAVDLE